MNPIDIFVALTLLVGLLVNTIPAIPIVAIGVVALRALSSRVVGWRGFRKTEWAVVICLTYWIANYFWSGQSLGELVSYDFLRNDGAMLISYPALVACLGWPLKPRHLRAFWFLFMIVSGFVAFAGMAQRINLPYSYILEPLGVSGFDPSVGGDMFYGWYHAHNTAGGAYAIASVIALSFMMKPNLGWKQQVFRWGLFVLCVGGLVVTYSRGAYIGFVVGAAVVLPLSKLRKNAKLAVAVAIPVIVVLVTSNSVLAHIDTISDSYWGTNADRLRLWKDAIDDFVSSPLIGIGYGRYNDADLQYSGVKNLVWVATHGRVYSNDSHAHNSFLHFLSEGGIVGLLVTMLVWIFAWKELSFFETHFARSGLAELERAARAAIAVAMVQATTEHILGRGSVVLILDALVGITLATARQESLKAEAATAPATVPSAALTAPARVRHEPYEPYPVR